MSALVIFAHGKESGPWGRKITQLAAICQQQGVAVLSPDYRDIPDDPDQRVAKLLSLELPPHDQLILVGSSMGGYVSAVASQTLQPQGLFLMAPALGIPTFGQVQQVRAAAQSIAVVVGWRDTIISLPPIFEFAQQHRAQLHYFDGGHPLEEVLPEIEYLFARFLQQIVHAG